MKIGLYKSQDGAIIKTNPKNEAGNWSDSEWIDIRFSNRKEIESFFTGNSKYEKMLECFAHPEQFPFVNTFEDFIVLSFSISSSHDIFKAEYITVVLGDSKLLTLIPMSSGLLNEKSLISFNPQVYPNLRNYLFYALTAKILAQGNENMSIARLRLQSVEHKLANNQDQLTSEEVMTCERDINQLSDIIEDQYVGFELLTSLRSSAFSQEEMQKASKLMKGYEPLNRAMLRLEKKAESLRIQYTIIQQEKSTRKINTLTIIQAVFVPLTFIAGVYGMNFIHMPELSWPYGYLLVWIVFIGLAVGLMSYFYRKGWFD